MRTTLFCVAVCIATMCCRTAPGQEARVEFEVVTDPDFRFVDAPKWQKVFEKLHVSVRIRSARPGDEVGVKSLGTEASPRYRVTGQLNDQSVLVLPGGAFRISDGARLAEWLKTLRSSGPETLTEPTGAFGLTSRRMLELRKHLQAAVSFTTHGTPVRETVNKLIAATGLNADIRAAAEQALASGEPVRDDLRGLSCGTALAAALRPLGLVLSVTRTGNQTRLIIADAQDVPEAWPVGWPPEKNPGETAPALFKFLNVEVEDTPLVDAVGAIQQRVGLPFLLDYNGLARERVDLATIRVSFPKKRTFYLHALEQILYQAKLKPELRVDESGKAFVWIGPLSSR